jgi:hypothetical protein
MSANRFACGVVLFLLCLVLAGPAWAQGLSCAEPFHASVRNMEEDGGNVFGCQVGPPNTESPPCDLSYRYYSDHPFAHTCLSCGADGNPIYLPETAQGGYHADVDNSQNYFGGYHVCGVPMYLVWDGSLDGGTGDHKGYYAAQSQIIEKAETGNIWAKCAGTTSVSCFFTANGANALPVTGTPQGTLEPLGGLAPIPVPLLAGSSGETVTLEWVAPQNWYQTGAVGGDPGTAPDPITGVNLYLLESGAVLDDRGVTEADLDAGARYLRFVPSGETTTVVDLTTDITPGTVSFLPVIRVAYRALSDGSPVESAVWSANGPTILTGQPCQTGVTGLDGLYVGKIQGETVIEVSWETTGESCLESLVLSRGPGMAGPWMPVGDPILPQGAGQGSFYAVEDHFQAGGARQVWYLLEIHDEGADLRTVGPIFVDVPPPGQGMEHENNRCPDRPPEH